MSLTLVKFGQEVDVATGSLDVAYFAIFQAANGLTLKLPLSEEASQTLIGFYATAKSPQEKVAMEELQEEMVSEEDQSAATAFGPIEDESVEEPVEEEQYEDQPNSEEEIPSL